MLTGMYFIRHVGGREPRATGAGRVYGMSRNHMLVAWGVDSNGLVSDGSYRTMAIGGTENLHFFNSPDIFAEELLAEADHLDELGYGAASFSWREYAHTIKASKGATTC